MLAGLSGTLHMHLVTGWTSAWDLLMYQSPSSKAAMNDKAAVPEILSHCEPDLIGRGNVSCQTALRLPQLLGADMTGIGTPA